MTSEAPQDELAIPLVLGVSGHRDAVESAAGDLVSKLGVMLCQLHAEYPNTPLQLLSPLAEGADQIAVRALAALPAAARVSFVAVLPMPRQLFEQDFAGAELQTFRQMLAQARRVIEIPLAAGSTAESVSTPGPARDHQYLLAGQYVSRHAQILLALWDGTNEGGVGGTADIVHFRERGHPEASDDSVLDLEDRGPTWHLVTPRRRHQGAGEACVPPEPYVGHWRYPPMVRGDLDPQQYFRTLWRDIDQFNANAAEMLARNAECARRSEQDLIPAAALASLPAPLALLRSRYARADALVITLQHRWRWLQRLMHLLAVAALLGLESGMFVHEVWESALTPWLFSFAALCMLLAFAAYRHGSKSRLQDRYQDYRALAEGLRVQFFWSLAGVDAAVADRYLGRQRNALDWIRKALRTASMPMQGLITNTYFPHVEAYWVRSQYEYFASARDQHREHVAARASRALLVCGVGSLLGLIAASWLHAPVVVTASCQCAFVVLTGIAGIVEHYAAKMAYGEHAKQYSRMARLYDYALQLLTEAMQRRDAPAQRRVVEDLGLAALEESGNWVQLHRERPLEMVHPS